MNEYPINLKSWEVQGILSGRKTQTRRPIKLPYFQKNSLSQSCWLFRVDNFLWHWHNMTEERLFETYLRQWKLGTRRWVRETWCDPYLTESEKPSEIPEWKKRDIVYRANGTEYERWFPSTQMPRWASRINLVIKRSWIERVQEITEYDSISEGMEIYTVKTATWSNRQSFSIFWDKSNKTPLDWSSNPWVVASEIEVG